MGKTWVVPVIIFVVVAIFVSILGQQMFSVIEDGCEINPILVEGRHIQDLADFRETFNQQITQSDFEELGIIQRDDGLYYLVCFEVGEQ